MNKYQFGLFITLLFFAGKVITIGFALYLAYWHVYEMSEVLDIMTIVTPLFSVYLTIMIRQIFMSKPADSDTEMMNWAAIVIGVLVPVLYVGWMLGCLYWKREHMDGIDNIKKGLGLVESILGIYLGIIISSVFKTEK